MAATMASVTMAETEATVVSAAFIITISAKEGTASNGPAIA